MELLTTSVAVVVWTTDPLVPVIVMGYEPGATPELVATDSVDEPPPATVAGWNVAVAPVGSPEAVRPTEPLNPFVAPTLTV